MVTIFQDGILLHIYRSYNQSDESEFIVSDLSVKYGQNSTVQRHT